MSCKHEIFIISGAVSQGDDFRFMATLQIRCRQCGVYFQFLGLPEEIDWNGAGAVANGREAKLAIGTPETIMNYYQSVITEMAIPKPGYSIIHESEFNPAVRLPPIAEPPPCIVT